MEIFTFHGCQLGIFRSFCLWDKLDFSPGEIGCEDTLKRIHISFAKLLGEVIFMLGS